MKIFKKIVLMFFVLTNFTSVFSGLLPETMVFMGNGVYKKAKDLKFGDYVPIYNIPTRKFERQKKKIEVVASRKLKEIILIKTENDVLTVGPKQKLYNRLAKRFVAAEEFRAGDILFSPEKGNIKVVSVLKKRLQNQVKLYEVAIKDGHLFLILTEGRTHILVHNFALSIPVLTWTFGGDLAIISLKALCAIIAGAFVKHCAEKLEENIRKPNSDLDDVLRGSDSVKKPNGSSDVYKKPGGKEQRGKDFEKLTEGRDVRTIKTDKGTIQVGTDRHGANVINRPYSGERSGNEPTVEVQHGKNDSTKVRYDD